MSISIPTPENKHLKFLLDIANRNKKSGAHDANELSLTTHDFAGYNLEEMSVDDLVFQIETRWIGLLFDSQAFYHNPNPSHKTNVINAGDWTVAKKKSDGTHVLLYVLGSSQDEPSEYLDMVMCKRLISALDGVVLEKEIGLRPLGFLRCGEINCWACHNHPFASYGCALIFELPEKFVLFTEFVTSNLLKMSFEERIQMFAKLVEDLAALGDRCSNLHVRLLPCS